MFSIAIYLIFFNVILLVLHYNAPVNEDLVPSTGGTPSYLSTEWITIKHTALLIEFEEILRLTREKIKKELINFNFSQSGLKDLKALLEEEKGRPLRTVIISTWQSGATFLGKILNSVPGTFYHFEPLSVFRSIIDGPPYANDALVNIKDLLNCKYFILEKYNSSQKKLYARKCIENTSLWEHCRRLLKLCYDKSFMEKYCKLFPFQLMKSVRLSLNLIEDVLLDYNLNVKVVYLVRDPRAVMISRLNNSDETFAPSSMYDIKIHCDHLIKDYKSLKQLKKAYPGRIMSIRFEDLATRTISTVRSLFYFLGLSVTSDVRKYLQVYSFEQDDDTPIHRIFKMVASAWVDIVDADMVREIQDNCKEALANWGYRFIHNDQQLDMYRQRPHMLYRKIRIGNSTQIHNNRTNK